MNKENLFTIILSAGVILFIVLAAAAVSEYRWFLWGISFYRLIPLPVLIIAALLCISLLVPSVQRRIMNTVTNSSTVIASLSLTRKKLLRISAAVGMLLIFWSFRTSFHFLGDGYLLLRNLPLIGSPIEVFGFYKNSPLAGFIYYGCFNILRLFSEQNAAVLTYQTVSMFCGVVSFFLLQRIGQELFTGPLQRFFFTAGVLSSAVSLQFFGYAENYAVNILFLLLFVWIGLRFLSGRTSFLTVTGIFAALILSHYGMIFAAPAYLYLLYRELRSRSISTVLLSGGLLLGIAAVIYFGVYASFPQLDRQTFGEKSRFLFQSFPDMMNYSYGFLSLRHWTDIINLMLLVSPVGFILLPFIYAGSGLRTILAEKSSLFIFILAAGMAMFVLLMKGELGMSRDWDLFSLFLFPSVILMMMFVLRHFPQQHRTAHSVTIAGVTFLHTALWVFVNSSATLSLRYGASLPNEQLWSRTALSNMMDELGSFYQARKEFRKSLEYNLKYQQYHPANVRIMENIGSTYYYIFSDDVNAEIWYRKAVGADSKDGQIYNNLGEIHLKRKDAAAALSFFKQSLLYDPASVQARLNIAFILGEVEGKKEEALELYLQVLQNEPDHANALMNAGYLSYQLKRYELTKRSLNRWLQLFPRDPNAENVRSLLLSLE